MPNAVKRQVAHIAQRHIQIGAGLHVAARRNDAIADAGKTAFGKALLMTDLIGNTDELRGTGWLLLRSTRFLLCS